MASATFLPHPPLLRSSRRDIIVSGQWQPWNGWMWWCWAYSGGWTEWVPAYKFLLQCTDEDRLAMPQFDLNMTELLDRLHEYFGLPEILDMYGYKTQQLQYNKEAKSAWWFATIPSYSF